MRIRMTARDAPGRVSTGVYILHAGIEKWSGDEQRATAVHGMAAGAFPMLRDMPAPRFLRLLAAGEIATGALLLLPRVPNRMAGAVLTAFSGGLVTMYWRTPALRKPGSVWPTPAGTGVSKDVWMLGIGLGLLAGGGNHRRSETTGHDRGRARGRRNKRAAAEA
ncbi:MAG: hypothetical protein ABSG81_04055 [Acidimicrobiales bacterium]|jgi:uncharacterized membrane protein YphA (DoxX/SURF4 family)